MQLWIQHQFKLTSGGCGASLQDQDTISTSSLDCQAQQIADQILARLSSSGPDAIADGEYAICLLNLDHINLHSHPDDRLNASSDLYNPGSGLCKTWADLPPGSDDLDTTSVWRINGVTVADSAIEYLTDQVVTRVLAGGAYFPKPLRIFFDEEHGRGFGMNSLSNIGAIESILTDSRWTSESLHGNFNLWDSSPSTTTASEIFTTQPLADIDGWRTACNPYLPHIYGVPNNIYSPGNSSHHTPEFDHEFFPIFTLFDSIMHASVDGAIRSAIDHPVTDTDWAGFKWSNYSTSIYYSPSYPQISGSNRGTLRITNPIDQRYGFRQRAITASAPIQSPVLYPPHTNWEQEVGLENGTSTTETGSNAWLRYARMQLDHAIFSFEEFDDLDLEAPRHIVPWVTRVGTIVYRFSGFDSSITTKDAVRDIIAVCKAKGVNEIIFWGDPGSESYGRRCDGSPSNEQYNWDATNDALAQVFDYTLNGVQVGPFWLLPATYASLTFSEEHAFDFAPAINGSQLTTAFSPRFSTGSVTTPATSYAFVLETIDGGGPWDAASFALQIYNFTTGIYETIVTPPTELYSSSGRRAVFTDTDSDGYSNTWEWTFDDQADMPSSTYVTDRKTIRRWDVNLPSTTLSHYLSNGNMQFKVEASHTTLPSEGVSPDPLRVDLVQLYETECENDRITSPKTRSTYDLNRDGTVNWEDISKFSNDHPEADLNLDGRVDSLDLQILIRAIQGI